MALGQKGAGHRRRRWQSVKILATGQTESRSFLCGLTPTPSRMVFGVKRIAADWPCDAVSIGYPGLVLGGRPSAEPVNLGPGSDESPLCLYASWRAPGSAQFRALGVGFGAEGRSALQKARPLQESLRQHQPKSLRDCNKGDLAGATPLCRS